MLWTAANVAVWGCVWVLARNARADREAAEDAADRAHASERRAEEMLLAWWRERREEERKAAENPLRLCIVVPEDDAVVAEAGHVELPAYDLGGES